MLYEMSFSSVWNILNFFNIKDAFIDYHNNLTGLSNTVNAIFQKRITSFY